MELLADSVVEFTVLAYRIPVLTYVLADTDLTFNCDAKTAAPATFRVPSDVMDELADNVVEFTVLA
jgi:hypothetical protein